MITILTGDNSFEIDQALAAIIASVQAEAERFDGESLTVEQLAGIFTGVSLFSQKRLVIVKDLSANKTLWQLLPDWLNKADDESKIVLVEPQLDKRTKTYKALKDGAEIKEYTTWSEKDVAKAEAWVKDEARRKGLTIAPSAVRFLVQRLGADQWALYHAVDRLSLLEVADEKTITEVIEPTLRENVFELFEAALRGDSQKIRTMLVTLEATEDPYQLFGLLASQASQLATVAVVTDSSAMKALGVHPFVASKLRPHATKKGRQGVRAILQAMVTTDGQMKRTSIAPWSLVAQALYKIAHI